MPAVKVAPGTKRREFASRMLEIVESPFGLQLMIKAIGKRLFELALFCGVLLAAGQLFLGWHLPCSRPTPPRSIQTRRLC
jgi:hypothetical protein